VRQVRRHVALAIGRQARGVGKRAADRLPGKKEKERWKDKVRKQHGRPARSGAARKAGADAEAVEAAGLAARTKAEAAFMTAKVSVCGLERATLPQPEPSEPPAVPSAATARAIESKIRKPMSAQAEACLEMAQSPERGGGEHDQKRIQRAGQLPPQPRHILQ